MTLTQITNSVISTLQRDYYLFPKGSKNSDSIKLIFINSVMDFVCDHRKIDKSELLSKDTSAEVVESRFIVIYLCMKFGQFPISATMIGKVLNRHHVTVLKAKQRFNDLYCYNRKFKSEVDGCENEFKKFQKTVTDGIY